MSCSYVILNNTLLERRHANIVIVALANKTARMAWALLRHDRDYDADWSKATASAQ
jgi:transposase